MTLDQCQLHSLEPYQDVQLDWGPKSRISILFIYTTHKLYRYILRYSYDNNHKTNVKLIPGNRT